MKTKRLLSYVIAMAATLGASYTWACTNLLVGKNASTDGSTIITYAADSHNL